MDARSECVVSLEDTYLFCDDVFPIPYNSYYRSLFSYEGLSLLSSLRHSDRSNSVEKQNHSEERPVVPKKPRKLPPVAKSNLYKTKMCKNFMDTGSCKYGRVCQFAHSKAELRKYSYSVC